MKNISPCIQFHLIFAHTLLVETKHRNRMVNREVQILLPLPVPLTGLVYAFDWLVGYIKRIRLVSRIYQMHLIG